MSCTRSCAKAESGLSTTAKADSRRTQSAADLSKANRMSTTFVTVSPLSIALPSTSGFPVSGGAALANFAPPTDEGSPTNCLGSHCREWPRGGARSVTVSVSASRRKVKTCPVRESGTVATKPSAVSTTVAFQPIAHSDFAPYDENPVTEDVRLPSESEIRAPSNVGSSSRTPGASACSPHAAAGTAYCRTTSPDATCATANTAINVKMHFRMAR